MKAKAKRFGIWSTHLLLCAGLGLPAAPASAASYVDCSSYDGRRSFCAVDTRGGVALDYEYGGSHNCFEGSGWGVQNGDPRGIWVDRSCRGRFRIADRPAESKNDTAAVVGGLILGGLILGALGSSHHHHDDNDNSGYRPPPRPPGRPSDLDLANGAIDGCSREAIAQGGSYGRRARVDRILDHYPNGKGAYLVEGYVKVDTNGSPLMFNFSCDWDGYRARVSLH